jgi:hypothetical protein
MQTELLNPFSFKTVMESESMKNAWKNPTNSLTNSHLYFHFSFSSSNDKSRERKYFMHTTMLTRAKFNHNMDKLFVKDVE